MYIFYNSRINVITLYSGHVCMYYVSMFRCWHLVWILVRTYHPCLGVGCHNRLPTTTIQAVCPYLALFGSAPSYEHLHVFGCTCYPNTTATAPQKLSSRSTRCVFLGYSTDHKGYHYLDLSINRLIVSRHVIFEEDSFPLVASPSLTDLYFLCESGPTVFTIGTHLTTAGTSPPASHRPAPEIPPGFEPLVANLPASAVPPGFLPRAATTVAPPPVIIGPPPCT
jgi:hypothetical protein